MSEPFLAPVGSGGCDHAAFAHALRHAGYDRWISIEMNQAGPGEEWLAPLIKGVRTVRDAYGVAPARAAHAGLRPAAG